MTNRRPNAAVAVGALCSLPLLLSACQGQQVNNPAGSPGQSPGAKPSVTQGKTVLRIGAIPDQKPEKLNRLYPLVADALGSELGVEVSYVPVVDYTAAVSAFRTGDLDLVWFGGLSGVQARLQTPGARVIAQRDIDARFHSVFIANKSSGLQPLSDGKGLARLKGRRFSFGSENSTSGTLMPSYYLAQAGVKPADFASGAAGYSGSHDTTIALVQSGSYEAGAVNEKVWRDNLRDGKADPAKVAVIWRTPPYHDYHWVAQPNLDQRFGTGFSDKLQAVILAWNPTDPEQQQILELFGAETFIEAQPADYAKIEQIGRQLGKVR